MGNVNTFLRENVSSICKGDEVQVAPQIVAKKLNNAIKSFGFSGRPSDVIAIFDNTVFGSAKDGLLFTGEQIIYKEAFTDPASVPYNTIASVELVETPVGDSAKVETSAVIKRHDGSSVAIKDLDGCKLGKLVTLLNSVISDFKDFKEERQLVPVEEMSEALKIAYIRAIINMAYDNDGVVDEREFAEILLLMTRIAVTAESRFTLRSYMASASDVIPLSEVMQTLNLECPSGQEKSLHVSLVKDLLNIYFSTGGIDPAQFAFLQKHRDQFKVSDQEIELAVMAIRNDHAMLKDDYTDDKMIAAIKLLSAKAAAVGTPLAAVYLSGSVVGLSAAGMTSGLAALGMGGLLGMSSMATGIGVAVLLGVGAYAGVRKLTGADELNQSKRRELMLSEIIKQTQSTISLLIQDINFLTERLNRLIQSASAQDSQIQKLLGIMRQLTSSGAVLVSRTQSAQQSAARLGCAQELDERKLRLLTREPLKAELFGYISGFYEARKSRSKVDGESVVVTKLVLKEGKTADELENLAKAFDTVGYFKVNDVIMGNAADLAERTKGALASLFK